MLIFRPNRKELMDNLIDLCFLVIHQNYITLSVANVLANEFLIVISQ